MSKVKVVHVAYEHTYDDTRIVRKECLTLEKSGSYDVLYITSNKNSDTKESSINNIKLEIINLNNQKGKRFLSFYKELKKRLTKIDADIYHIHESILLPLIPFLKRKGKKVIYDLHENTEADWFKRFKRYGKTVAILASKTINAYEKHCIKKIDGFIYVTYDGEKQMSSQNLSLLLPNYPILSDWTQKTLTYEEYNSNEKSICFAGGISETWSQKKIIDSIENIDNITYNLAGKIEEDYLIELKELPGWNKVNFKGMIPFAEVQNLYFESKIGMALLSRKFMENEKGTLGNTKIYEYMLAGLPIICTDFEIWVEIVDKYKCGIYINPKEKEIKKAIKYLFENQEEAFEMGRRGNTAVNQEYNWEKYETQFIHFYSMIKEK